MSSRPDRPATRRDDGFTLVELLVALVISGILTGVIFQVIGGNSRFVSMQSAREEVQQNSRAAADLISGDLRAAASVGIVAMQPNSVRLRVPRAWGITCNDVGTSSAEVWAIFPANTIPAEFAPTGQQPHWGVAIHQTADPTVNTNQYRFVSAVQAPTGANPCGAVQTNLTAQHVTMGFRKSSGNFIEGGITIRAGTPIMIFEEVQYDVAQPGGSGDFWVRRMVGYTGTTPNMQPMAGPVPAADALRFTYLQSDGSTVATSAAQVRQIRLDLTTHSRSRSMQNGQLRPQQTDSTSVDVFLRN
jgi:prepilin-type N-terminal cleavage/methylation domain-containing protein